MLDIMLDLESMGCTPDSAIVGIGAVEFDLSAGRVGNTFFRAVNLADAVRQGCKMDPGTVAWWLSQSKEAQRAITQSTYALKHALTEFSDFVGSCGPQKEVRMWGNGPSFDNAMLAHAYHACDIKQPWAFWNDRCVRTLRALYPSIQADEFVGEKHNAVDDAMAQVQHLIKIRESVRARVAPKAVANA